MVLAQQMLSLEKILLKKYVSHCTTLFAPIKGRISENAILSNFLFVVLCIRAKFWGRNSDEILFFFHFLPLYPLFNPLGHLAYLSKNILSAPTTLLARMQWLFNFLTSRHSIMYLLGNERKQLKSNLTEKLTNIFTCGI